MVRLAYITVNKKDDADNDMDECDNADDENGATIRANDVEL